MKSTALKAYFQTERVNCNQMVASVRHQYPNLNLDDFDWFLSHCLDPLMMTLEGQGNRIKFPVAHAGFQHGLELTSFSWAKSEFKKALLLKAWNNLFPRLVAPLIQHPGELFAGTINSLSNILAFGEQKPNTWLDLMITSSDEINALEQFKITGILCAWLAGLAHFREIALNKMSELPDESIRKLFKLSDSQDLGLYFHQLKASRWLNAQPKRANTSGTEIQERYRIGKCSLVGGDFPATPRVFVENDQLYVLSGEHIWRLYADSFGVALISGDNLLPENVTRFDKLVSNNPKLLSKSCFGDLNEINSLALLDDTLVVASLETFSVIIAEYSGVSSGARS